MWVYVCMCMCVCVFYTSDKNSCFWLVEEVNIFYCPLLFQSEITSSVTWRLIFYCNVNSDCIKMLTKQKGVHCYHAQRLDALWFLAGKYKRKQEHDERQFTLSSHVNLCSSSDIPRIRTRFWYRGLSVAGPREWGSLSLEIRIIIEIPCFKRALITHFCNLHYNWFDDLWGDIGSAEIGSTAYIITLLTCLLT